jgi:hypothetical protein
MASPDGAPGALGGGEVGGGAPASRGVSPSRDGAERTQQPVADAPARPKASGASRAAGRSEAELLASLREEVARLGVQLDAGWTCVVKPRGGDISAGRRYRSRQEVR